MFLRRGVWQKSQALVLTGKQVGIQAAGPHLLVWPQTQRSPKGGEQAAAPSASSDDPPPPFLGDGPAPRMEEGDIQQQAEHCNDRKMASKRVQELSADLFFAVFVKVRRGSPWGCGRGFRIGFSLPFSLGLLHSPSLLPGVWLGNIPGSARKEGLVPALLSAPSLCPLPGVRPPGVGGHGDGRPQ